MQNAFQLSFIIYFFCKMSFPWLAKKRETVFHLKYILCRSIISPANTCFADIKKNVIKIGDYDIKQISIANQGVTKFVESLQQIVHRLQLPKSVNSQQGNPNQ